MVQLVSSGVNKNGLVINGDGMALTSTISRSEAQWAAGRGDSYNINTGTIALTSSTASGILYYKHNEDMIAIIESIAIGTSSAGTTSDVSTAKIIRNPAAGTLISAANPVDMNQNKNFGSSNALSSSLAYKGVEGSTVTDGDEIVQFFMGSGSRLFANVGFEMQKGNSIAITLNTNTSSGTTNAYAAIVLHVKDL